MKVVIDNKIPFINGVLEKYFDVVYLEGDKIARKDLLNAHALIIRTRTKCNADLLKGTKVQFIATATAGFDHIDTEYCRSKNITWTSAEGCNASAVQQYIASALFYLAEEFNFSLTNKILGVVGVGNVGEKVVRLGEVLEMQVLLNDPPRERREGSKLFVSLDQIIDSSDIVTLHVPLNYEGIDKSYHLIDRKILSRMKKHQILVNTSRGEVVETDGLKHALRNNVLMACVLDVWENEPNTDLDLLSMVKIGTPHIAGYSVDGKANGTAMSVRAISRYFGLNLNDWYPKNIPCPTLTKIELDCLNQSQQRVMGKIIRSTYDILEDDRRFRNSPHTFEKQRTEYPVRREFGVYTVHLINADKDFGTKLKKIGFK